MTATVLVPLEDLNLSVDTVRASTLELITLGRTLGRVDVLTLGAPSVEALATLGAYGVEVVHQAALPPSLSMAQHRLTSVLASVLVATARRIDADVLLFPSASASREAAAVAAARLGAGLITDASDVWWQEDRVHASKSELGGSWDVVASCATDPVVVTVRGNAVVPQPVAVASHPEVTAIPVDVPEPLVTVVSRQVRPVEAHRPSLEEASVVVAAGRGVAGDFTAVNQLADALDAAVGATRDVVFDGHFDRYIGQTGVTISPRVYIGAGISGAVHHTAGIASSQHIIAVNNDADAPIFDTADFGVVGDAAAVLPRAAQIVAAHRAEREL